VLLYHRYEGPAVPPHNDLCHFLGQPDCTGVCAPASVFVYFSLAQHERGSGEGPDMSVSFAKD
jgi:hypothetical protein